MLQGTHQHPHKKPVTPFDHLMQLVAFLAPFLTIPQFLDIMTTKNVSGLSITTWGGYTIVSVLWVFYWKEHHQKWIFVSQVMISLLNAGILAGILLYSTS